MVADAHASRCRAARWRASGFGASGTVDDRDERDYRYGVMPQTQLGLRLIFGDRAMLEATSRQYYVVGIGSGAGSRSERFGQEIIGRGGVGVTVRVWGPHALGLQYLVSKRERARPTCATATSPWRRSA